jgi:acetolactate synthase I/II/III large subunit
MTSSELSTASHYNIGVKVLILNNDFQGMVRQWQGLYRSFFSLGSVLT